MVAGGTTYYVDSISGRDSNPGTSVEGPWQTIARVNGYPFAPGDRILFRRGGEWRETLEGTRGGTAPDPVLFGAYGSGERPIINSAERVEDWTAFLPRRNVWRSRLSWATAETPVEVLFVHGQRGRKKADWSALSAAGDWCWDPAGRNVYLYSAGTPDSVEVAARDHGILLRDGLRCRYVVIKDFEIRYARLKSVLIGAGNDFITLANLIAHHNGEAGANDRVGISVRGCDYTTIRGCTIYESGENAIQVVRGSHNLIEKCVIFNPHHHGIDVKGGTSSPESGNIIRCNTVFALPGFTDSINGIAVVSEAGDRELLDTLIDHNVIYDIPDNGILVVGDAAQNTRILNNTIVDSGAHNIHLLNGELDTVVLNNIGVTTSTHWAPTLRMESTTNKVVDYNCWLNLPAGSDFVQINRRVYYTLSSFQAATGLDVHSISLPPRFINEGARDFRLAPDSPCIGRGVPSGFETGCEGTLLFGDVNMGALQPSVNDPDIKALPLGGAGLGAMAGCLAAAGAMRLVQRGRCLRR